MNYNYEIGYFEQVVDHFGFSLPSENFTQRYLISFDFWQSGGPILFSPGEETDIESIANFLGFVWETAELFSQSGEYFPCVLFAEHRYYGESIVPGQNNKPPDFRYLTVEQALADYVELIRYLKNSTPGLEDSPVISIGGSYGGMLSAWIRIRYPNDIIGALASSAPILLFSGLRRNTSGFYEITTRDFPTKCSDIIRESWFFIRQMANQTNGLEFLSQKLHLCFTISNVDDLINWIVYAWTNLAVAELPFSSSFLIDLPAFPIEYACNLMEKSSSNIIDQIYAGVNVFWNFTGVYNCFTLYDSGKKNKSRDKWTYQTCTEMIFPMSSTGVEDMFEPNPWNFKEYAENCRKSFPVTSRENWMKLQFGGENISSSSNIIFSNGLKDPWASGGLFHSISDTLIALIMPSASHHNDLFAANPADPIDVIETRNIERQWFKKWINEYELKIKFKSKYN